MDMSSVGVVTENSLNNELKIRFHKKRSENDEDGAARSGFTREQRLQMLQVTEALALFLFSIKYLFGLRAKKNCPIICFALSGFSWKCHPRLVIVHQSVSCSLDGIIDKHVHTYRFSG